MHARVSFYDGTVDDAAGSFEQARSAIEQMDGFRGAMLLLDREGGEAITITLWESEAALRASAEQANRVRQESAGRAGLSIREVKAYEVAMEFGR